MDVGLQLFSVRDAAQEDLARAVRQVAGMGYERMEFAGFFGHSAQEVRRMLEESGAALSGTHSPLEPLLEDYEATAAFHRALGNRFYIVPGADLDTGEKLDRFIEDAARLCPRLARDGIELCYHNHDHEFRPNRDGRVIFDELVERTALGLELDTFWAYAAGKDPAALMERLGPRLRFVHLKDGFPDGRGMPLGRGSAPVRAVYAKARQMGVPIIVESETLSPDGMTEARVCMEYLRKLG